MGHVYKLTPLLWLGLSCSGGTLSPERELSPGSAGSHEDGPSTPGFGNNGGGTSGESGSEPPSVPVTPVDRTPGAETPPSNPYPSTSSFYPPRADLVAACGPTTERGSANVGVRRLTKAELLRAAQEAVGASFDFYDLQQLRPYRDYPYTPYERRPRGQVLMNEIPPEISDPPGEAFSDLFGDDQMSAWSIFVDWLAEDLAASPWARVVTAAPCFRDGNADAGSRACFEQFLGVFGPRAYRRPLTTSERSSIVELALGATSWREGVERVIARVFMSPYFVHEIGSTDPSSPSTGTRSRVSQFELANRVAFALTGGPPDATLRAAAEAGQLTDLDSVRTHASRIIRTDAAKQKLMVFFEDWLELGRRVQPWSGWTRYNGLGYARALADEIPKEARAFVDYVVWELEGSYSDLMTAPIAFVTSERLKSVYGTDRIAASGPVAAPNHPGILTRAAVLVSTGYDNNAILRAIKVKFQALCQYLPQPDFSVVSSRQDELEEADPVTTPGHEIISNLTSDPTCHGCHQFINPVGFLFEAYNPMGQYQTVQHVLRNEYAWPPNIPPPSDVTDIHAIAATFPLPSGQVFSVEAGAAPKTYDDVNELIGDIARSARGRACLTSRFFRHIHRRSEVEADACALREGSEAMADLPLLDAFVATLVNEDIFWRRL